MSQLVKVELVNIGGSSEHTVGRVKTSDPPGGMFSRMVSRRSC